MILIFLIGIIGNSCVILVVLKYSIMQTNTNIYILSLSLADILFLTSIPLFLYTVLTSNFPPNDLLCKIYISITIFNWFFSTFSLTGMSIDRFLAIVFPIRSKNFRSKSTTIIIIIILWFFALALMSPGVINARLEKYSNNKSNYYCRQLWYGNYISYILYIFSLGYLIPSILIIVFYSGIIISLFRLKSTSKVCTNKRQKTTKLVALIVAVYILSWLPYWINQIYLIGYIINPLILNNQSFYNSSLIVQNYNYSTQTDNINSKYNFYSLYLTLLYQLFGYLNSALNPILYSYMSGNFRTAFKIMIFRSKGNVTFFQKKSHPNPNDTYESNKYELNVKQRLINSKNNCESVNKPNNCLIEEDIDENS